MFRCSECQKEYDIKPDYCEECGNDIFEEILTVPKETKEQTPPEAPTAAQTAKTITEEKQTETIKQDIKIQREEPKKQMSPEDIASFGIFGLCLLLSFIIVFFINPAPKEETVVKKEEIKIADIPSLDSFWNNKPPEVQVEQKPQQPVIKMPEVQPVQEVPVPPEPKTTKVELKYFPKNNVNNQAKVQSKAQPKIQNTTQPKTTAQPKTQPKTQTNTQIQKPANNTQQQTKTPVAQNKPTATKSTQQPTQQKPTAQPVQTTTQPQQVQKTQTVQTQTTQSHDVLLAQRKEFSAYKVNLRNTIGRKIDFADVIGDGSCTVSFKIDSTGKLINRAFSKQSSNLTLNDAVYKAVMQTPSYNPPPSGYKGETLSLKISFYNGNFEINLN